MPEKLDQCVVDLLADPDFKPRGGQDKKSAAFAVCQATMKGQEAGDTGYEAVEVNGRFEAVWSTAQVNDLPDSSFAAISPGGEKDSEGKTTPRSLRHLPHHGPGGGIDKPHLNNALSRLSQTNISSEMKSKALSHLKSHQGKQGKQGKSSSTETTVESLVASPITEAEREFTGKEWHVRIITAGMSMNKREYPLDVLHRDRGIFENAPVHAAFGEDHSLAERGVKGLVGFVRDIKPVPEGLDGTLHISDPNLRQILLDFYTEGVLDSMVGISIVADGMWSPNGVGETATAVELLKSDSVDLVRTPAAGGKFLNVIESTTTKSSEADMVLDITEEKLEEMLTSSATKAAEMAVEKARSSILEELEAKHPMPPKNKDKPPVNGDGDPAAKGKEADDDEEEMKRKAKKKAEEEAALVTASRTSEAVAVTKQMSDFLLNQSITEAKLPESAEVRVRAALEGKPFDRERTVGIIKSEKDYLASHEKTIVENLTSERKLIVRADENDKVLARLDAMFTDEGFTMIGEGAEQQKIKGFRGWKEAYCSLNGLNPYEVDGEEVWQAWSLGTNNYSSSRTKEIARSYEAFFQRTGEALLQQSTWAQVTADRMHKALIRNYENLPQYDDWRKVARVISVNDYQTYRDIKIGGYANLAVVVEGGVYPDLPHPTDEETTVQLRKHGGIAPQITRELILNDNVRAVAQIPKELALSAKRTLYEAVFDIFSGNAVYGPDSTVLFHTDHNNTGTTALAIAGVDLAQVAMRSQTRYGSTPDVLGAANLPKLIMVPNELQGLAQRIANPSGQFFSYSTADTDAQDDPDRFKGQLEVVVLDYWTNITDYFLVADPAQVMGIGVAFLNGKEEPDLFIQQNENVGEMFTMDVQNIKVRQEFREVITDYRPFYMQNVA